jgi:hypothetical protein
MTCVSSEVRLLFTHLDHKTILRMSTNVTNEAFAAALNTEFVMHLEASEAITLKLVQHQVPLLNAVQECFTLLFQAPPHAPNQQSLRTLQHATLGELEMFLVPVKKTEEGLFYEAVFNRLLK